MRVIGLHFILSAYGFWLPNDPRGSWSTVIRRYELLAFGGPTKVETTSSVAAVPHDHAARRTAKRALKYPPVRFDGRQARAIAQGFADACGERGYAAHALAVLPDHAHVLTAWHPRHVDEIAAHLKAKAAMRLNREGRHPMVDFPRADGSLPSPWARNHWCPFIRSTGQMRTVIGYVQRNPLKAGLPAQRWNLVQQWHGGM